MPDEGRRKTPFVIARGPMRWALKVMGLSALTMPWKVVYVLLEDMANLSLIKHELVHIRQIERDGPWRFTVRYLWGLARHGYRKNPYEVEAYGKAPVDVA